MNLYISIEKHLTNNINTETQIQSDHDVLKRTILRFTGDRELFHRVTGGVFGTPPLSKNEKTVLRLLFRNEDRGGRGQANAMLQAANLTFDYCDKDEEAMDREEEKNVLKDILDSSRKRKW